MKAMSVVSFRFFFFGTRDVDVQNSKYGCDRVGNAELSSDCKNVSGGMTSHTTLTGITRC